MRTSHRPCQRDEGSILPITLVISLVLSVVVISVANYTATTLRYGQVIEARAGRLAAANGAMDDALEKLAIRRSVCATAVGAGPGINVPFPAEINGTSVMVNCRQAGGAPPSADGWAIVITGIGASAPSFQFTLGGSPSIGGPVYLHNPHGPWVQLSELTIKEGDLWYPDSACAETVPELAGETQFSPSLVSVPNLSFEPGTRGVYCINRSWDALFGTAPTVSPALATLPDNPPFVTVGSCRVFRPGRYTSLTHLPLASNNYFMSGVYLFDGVGTVSLGSSKNDVTFGHNNFQGFPQVGNTACDAVRTGSAPAHGGLDDGLGATVYVRGNTRFEVGAQSGLEVAGRLQGSTIVSLQVLDARPYSPALISADSGSGKEVAMWGLVWAPTSLLVLDTIPAQKAASLRGGAVLAGFRGSVSAAPNTGFAIEVPTSASNTKLILEATATDDRSSNTVRAVIDYRPTTGEVAVNSRRVVN